MSSFFAYHAMSVLIVRFLCFSPEDYAIKEQNGKFFSFVIGAILETISVFFVTNAVF